MFSVWFSWHSPKVVKRGGSEVDKVAWAYCAFPSPLRAASEVPHGSSSLDSGAAGGGRLGPGPPACPCPVSWAPGVIRGGSEGGRGAKLEGISRVTTKGTALGRKRMMNWDGGGKPAARELGTEGCEQLSGYKTEPGLEREGGGTELGKQTGKRGGALRKWANSADRRLQVEAVRPDGWLGVLKLVWGRYEQIELE